MPNRGLGGALVASLLLLPAEGRAAAEAVQCARQWTEPVVCELTVAVHRETAQDQQLGGDATLRVRPGERVELQVVALDQHGRTFPTERVRYGWETGRECSRLLSLEEHGSSDHLLLQAGSVQGSCELLLWLPGNLNLDRRLTVTVAAVDLERLDARQAERVVESLYRGLLRRSPDARGLREATAQIRAGRLTGVVEEMCTSREFTQKRQRTGPNELLIGLFEGLLERQPDRTAVDAYLEPLRQGRCAEVVLSILRSEEFEDRLLGLEVRPGHRH